LHRFLVLFGVVTVEGKKKFPMNTFFTYFSATRGTKPGEKAVFTPFNPNLK